MNERVSIICTAAGNSEGDAYLSSGKMIGATVLHTIGVGKELPPRAFRTVRAVFPHTALQSLVSSSGVSRPCMGGL